MSIRIFFEYEGLVVQLPVNPAQLTVEHQGNNETMEIISLGEINILRDTKLKSVSFECFLPALINKDNPYVVTSNQFEEPQFYKDFFEKIRKEKKPVRFIVTDTDINMLVGIESFSPSLIALDEDTSYSIELKEWKSYQPITVNILPAQTTNTQQPTKVTTTKPRTPTGFAIGDSVIANGKYYYTSYGDGPTGNFNNFKGKISHIVADKTRKYRYHIVTPSGGYRGWVSENQLKR